MPTWPHDDTASLTVFYGPPGTPSNMVLVKPPWPMTYEDRPIRGVQIHRKCADSLARVFNDIAQQVGHDWSKLPAGAVKFSGSYNYRPIRGSSRASCHAFGAAIDMDAEHNPMNTSGGKGDMSSIVIDAFKREGWYWGGDFHSRQDPMHFQGANEGSRVAELATELSPVSTADAAEMPPMTDGHDSMAEEAEKPQATIEELPADRPIKPDGDTEPTPPKSMLASKISNTQIIAGGGAVIAGGSQLSDAANEALRSAAANPELIQKFGLVSILQHALEKPIFWFALIIVVAAGLTIYWRWKDHGRGNPALTGN